jgi:ABC-type nitrate/sulfonate/bicarbonate transport system ATPase subunit
VAPVSLLALSIAEKRFPAVGEAEPRLVLKDLAFEVPQGQFLCLTGPSGCGKTTTLNIIAGLDTDYRGTLRLPAGGAHAPRIGYVFQSPRLLPWRTVLENVTLVMAAAERQGSTAEGLLRDVGLWESRHFYPSRLSLGMQRRVAIARAYAVSPDILLMDEPFASLDEATAQHLRRLLVDLWQRRPTTVVFVTHDLREAIMLADRLLIFSPCPARVIADMEIPLARGDRRDPDKIDAVRRTILGQHEAVLTG